MTYDDANAVTQKEKRISQVLAIAIHLGFLVLLVFGISWQKRHTEAPVIVELWDSVTPPRPEKPVLKPLPKVEPKPEPKPEPRPEPKAAPKPELKPLPKPDIALKEKLEKERKLKEQQELEKKKEDEAKKLKAQLDAKKKDEDKKKLEQDRLAQETEKRLAQEKQELAKRLENAQRSLMEKYEGLIKNHVRRQIIEPPNLPGNPEVEFDVVLIPGGEVLTVKLRRASGVAAYDAAVERAIWKASPIPLPPDPTLFQQFRNLHLKFRPKE